MTRFLQLETADALVMAYEQGARMHQGDIRRGDAKRVHVTCFPLLMLNAAIVEGILRGWLVSAVRLEMDRLVREGRRHGKLAKDRAEVLLERFAIDVDTQGGYDRLSGQYGQFFGWTFADKVAKPDLAPIDVLFVLRNVLAHGTSLVVPVQPAPSPDKRQYVDKWQTSLQRAREYLSATFQTPSVLDALARPELPAHFHEVTKTFLAQVRQALQGEAFTEGEAFGAVTRLNFGFIDRTR